jgi:MFS family permease
MLQCILYMDEWFVRRKGFAYGIMWSGTGLGGIVLPLMMQSLLGKYGYQVTLRLWSGLLFVITVPLAWFIKPRLPIAPAGRGQIRPRPFDLRFMTMPSFMIYQATNILEAMGYFLPSKLNLAL